VQASCHGRYNEALLDGLRASGGLARGIAVVDDSITADELAIMHDAGVRGVRVFDHMARPDIAKGVDHPDFNAFTDLMSDEKFWAKVSCPERLTKQGGSHENYSDVLPFMKRVVDTYPDRVLWGTDWPHPNMKSHVPDDGQLVELIPLIADTEDKRQKLLVDNPMRLYWT